MATPCALLWPRLPPLLPLLLLLLLGVSQTRGSPPLLVPTASPRGQLSGAPLPATELEPEREPEPEPGPPLGLPPPLLPVSWEQENSTRAPASPGPLDPPPRRGAATQRGTLRQAPGGRSATTAAMKSHKPDKSSELRRENFTTSSLNYKNISTVVLKDLEKFQNSSNNRTTLDASGSTTLALETSKSRGSTTSYSRMNATPALGHFSEIPSALSSLKNSSALESFHQASNSSESEGRTATFVTISDFLTRVKERTFRSLTHTTPSMEAREGTIPSTEISTPSSLMHTSTSVLETEGPNIFSSGRNHTKLPQPHFSRTTTYPTPSTKSPSPKIRTEARNSIALNALASQTDRTNISTTFIQDASKTSANRSWLVNGPEGSTKYSRMANSSASTHASSSLGEARRKSTVTRKPSDAKSIEPSTDDTFEHPSSRTSALSLQNDSSTFKGDHQLPISDADAGDDNSRTQTEAGLHLETFTRDGKDMSHWFTANQRALVDVRENSTSYPEIVNPLVLTQLSTQWTESRTDPDDAHLLEPSTGSLSASSSETLDSSSQRHPLYTEGNHELGRRSDSEESTSSFLHPSPDTSATSSRNGERTLRSLTNSSLPSDGEEHFTMLLRGTEGTIPHLGVTDTTDSVSASSDTLQTQDATGSNHGPMSSTHIGKRTPSYHTDSTYISSTFAKVKDRTLLSITNNSTSPDTIKTSTTYNRTSGSLALEQSSSSAALPKGNNISSSEGEFVLPSTEPLVVSSSDLPAYTSTVSVPPNTLLLQASESVSTDDSFSSSSLSPLPSPSVSQPSQPFSSTLWPTLPSSPLLFSMAKSSKSTSSSLPPLSTYSAESTPPPTIFQQSSLPHLSSTSVLPSDDPQARESSVTSPDTLTDLFTTVVHGSPSVDQKNQSVPYQEETSTGSNLQPPSLPPTESTEVLHNSTAKAPLPSVPTESFREPTLLAATTNSAQPSAVMTTTTHATIQPSTISTELPPPMSVLTTVKATTQKTVLPVGPRTTMSQRTTEGPATTEASRVETEATTKSIRTTGIFTPGQEPSSGGGDQEENAATAHLPVVSSVSPQTTEASTPAPLTLKPATVVPLSSMRPTMTSPSTTVNRCAANPCLHDGKCVVDSTGRGYRCICTPSWQGDDCSVDVNECLSNPCPPLAICNNTQGSFVCRCPVGHQLEKGICNLVRTFVTETKLRKTFANATLEKHSELLQVEDEIIKMLNISLSTLPGYARSTVQAVRDSGTVVVSLQTTFSLASNVTVFELAERVQKYVSTCTSPVETCQFLKSLGRLFRAGSLCKKKSPECDKETSICTDLEGVALCQCKAGYFQFNKMDHSCRACEDGYRLENETCMSCPFGLGGLNCGNPYQLITVVIAAAGGGLLLILGIALIVTCCRKNKNDISKLIFKSGDFQMSPYAEYPKNPRSQEWGREAIEMHENGSTKNLLQMTDVYYSPTNVRNPELERNGLYPTYTGLPGSRHSCIFPGQYNPSFISDESRRRDYF
ncbi:protein HEG homolog 1 [Phascolarctos cinereus]|uniref:Protein HEG homolog 1 n=1 Tax=Phascolarctos cinereus TaxID=38626 RepID=A0A6P5KA18_PHACI|nr:protein HEG homolog 1 [Phascolarctos cinereus]